MVGEADGALASGSVFHTLMEVRYMPEACRNLPLRGTDFNPVLPDETAVIDWYLNRRQYAAAAVDTAYQAYLRYKEHYDSRGDEITKLVWDRPEPNFSLDVGEGQVYEAQYDAIIRHPTMKGVCAVEHKLLAQMRAGTISQYAHSGQLIGQVMIWNGNKELVAEYGPMVEVWLNLAFKKGKLAAHRERLAIPARRVHEYKAVVREMGRRADSLMNQYRHTISSIVDPGERAIMMKRHFMRDGMAQSQCVEFWGTCRYLDLCETEVVSPELYRIEDPAAVAQAARDGVVKVLEGVLHEPPQELREADAPKVDKPLAPVPQSALPRSFKNLLPPWEPIEEQT